MRFLGGGEHAVFALAATAFAAHLVTAPARAQPAPAAQPGASQSADKPAQIDRNGVLILIRSSLLAVDQANKTGNYTVLRDLGAPGFQSANTATRLGEIFANLRSQNLDLSGVAVLEPQLTVLPTIGANGMMRMVGFFPSVPTQINFELLYAPVDSRWRLFGIGLNLSPSGPTAPADPAQTAAPPAATPAPEANPGTAKPSNAPKPSAATPAPKPSH